MAVYSANFSTGDVLKAAGVGNPTLQTWIRRDFIIGHGGEGVEMPGKAGHRRRFSFHNLVEITLAAALSRAGVDVATAFRAASRFAHTGASGRYPALPFPNGRTLLCVAGNQTLEVNALPGKNWHSAARHYMGRPEVMHVLDVSDLFDRAMAAIGHHPQQVMDEGYGPQIAREASDAA